MRWKWGNFVDKRKILEFKGKLWYNSNNDEFDVNETTQINEIANAENNRRLEISLDMLAENE